MEVVIISGTIQIIPMTDPTRVGEARRVAQRLVREAGGDETLVGKVGVIVTEGATNLVKHASQGMVALRLERVPTLALDVLCYDRGPGIPDVQRCLSDGFSTRGTSGTGLGAMRRMADRFDIHSVSGKGTVVAVRVGSPATFRNCRFGAVAACTPGETACGDGWAVQELPDRLRLMVVDGLGHGPHAAAAADAAIRVMEKQPGLSLPELLRAQHLALRATRGAAVAVVDVLRSQSKLLYSGVGNIAGTLLTPGAPSRGLMSHAGIVGHELSRVVQLEFPWSDQARVVLASDGISAKWTTEAYPGILGQDPAILAATLFRDNLRGRDDATVVALGTT